MKQISFLFFGLILWGFHPKPVRAADCTDAIATLQQQIMAWESQLADYQALPNPDPAVVLDINNKIAYYKNQLKTLQAQCDPGTTPTSCNDRKDCLRLLKEYRKVAGEECHEAIKSNKQNCSDHCRDAISAGQYKPGQRNKCMLDCYKTDSLLNPSQTNKCVREKMSAYKAKTHCTEKEWKKCKKNKPPRPPRPRPRTDPS